MRSVEVSNEQSKVTITYDERRFAGADDVHTVVLAQVVEAMSLIGLPVAVEETDEGQEAAAKSG